MDAEFGGVEIQNGVADELSGPVVGDIAAAIGLVEFNALRRELFFGEENMPGGVGSSCDGDDWVMLDHHDATKLGLWGLACIEDLGVVVLLELVGGLVGEVLERDEGERFHRQLYPVRASIDL